MVSVRDRVKLQDSVKLIRSESDQLTRYVNALPEDALNHPSACELWQVADVVAHLVWFMEYYTDFIASRALRGDLSPVPDQPEGDTVAALDAFHATRAIIRRARLGDQLRPTFTQQVDRMNARFAGYSQADWEKPMRVLSGTATVATLLDLAIQEFPVHGWDIRSRLEGSASLSAESVPHLIAWIPRRFRMPWFVEFLPDAPPAAPVSYRFDVAEAVTGLTVVDNKLQIAPASDAEPDVTFHCDAETFVLLMYKRLTLREATDSGRLAAEGDNGLIAAFDRWLKKR